MSQINNSQAIELKFKKSFTLALQQQKSLLRGSGVVEEEMDIGGSDSNYPLVDALGDFTEITQRKQANAFDDPSSKLCRLTNRWTFCSWFPTQRLHLWHRWLRCSTAGLTARLSLPLWAMLSRVHQMLLATY